MAAKSAGQRKPYKPNKIRPKGKRVTTEDNDEVYVQPDFSEVKDKLGELLDSLGKKLSEPSGSSAGAAGDGSSSGGGQANRRAKAARKSNAGGGRATKELTALESRNHKAALADSLAKSEKMMQLVNSKPGKILETLEQLGVTPVEDGADVGAEDVVVLRLSDIAEADEAVAAQGSLYKQVYGYELLDKVNELKETIEAEAKPEVVETVEVTEEQE